MSITCGVVIYRWIRRGEPSFKVLPHLVPLLFTCDCLYFFSYSIATIDDEVNFIIGTLHSVINPLHLVDCVQHVVANTLHLVTDALYLVVDAVYLIADAQHLICNTNNLVINTMCSLQTLRRRHPNFVLGQFVQSPQSVLDISPPH
ncbi:hypothetical protein BJV74DRAFT_857080 [Russula compacta]|nr:hypothetical protein BJV74DRAFT_857080 [Russula compacta]